MPAWVYLDDKGYVAGGGDYTRDRPIPRNAMALPEGAKTAEYVGKRWAGKEWVDAVKPGLEPEKATAKKDAEKELANKQAALRYLAETDWYITRLTETGKPVPASILKKRATARETISAIDGEKE